MSFTIEIKKLSIGTDKLIPVYRGKLTIKVYIIEEIVSKEKIIKVILIESSDYARIVNE